MSNPNKAKGSRWELAIDKYTEEHWPAVRSRPFRPRQEGFADVGDIHLTAFTVQAKDWRDWQAAIREGLDGAVVQAEHRRERYGDDTLPVAYVKRARRGTGDGYAVMRIDDHLALAAELERLREQVARSRSTP